MATLAAITRDDIAKFLHQSEMALVEEETLSAVIVTVCDEVNAYASACSRNPQIKPGAGAVPPELKHAACILIRKAILGGLPGTSEELDQSTREAEYQAARETLREAAACKLSLSDYSDDENVDHGEDILAGSQPLMNFMPL